MEKENLNDYSDSEILNMLMVALPMVQQAMDADAGVSLTDCEKFLLYKAGARLDLKVPDHAPLKPGSGVQRAILEQRRIDMRFDGSLYGLPYTSAAVPIKNGHGQVIGAIAITQSVERQENMKTMAVNLLDSVTSLAATTEEVAAQAEEIATVSRTAATVTQASQQRIKETDQVLGLIKSIAGQTNLLGLNAAIEAARVGEHGRGFGVVAEEIRKLAAHSNESIKKIEDIIKAIQTDGAVNQGQMQQIDASIGQVSEAITQAAAMVQKIGEVVKELDETAETL